MEAIRHGRSLMLSTAGYVMPTVLNVEDWGLLSCDVSETFIAADMPIYSCLDLGVLSLTFMGFSAISRLVKNIVGGKKPYFSNPLIAVFAAFDDAFFNNFPIW